MAWYADLSTACMIARGEHVRAIGWLAAGRHYPTGDPQPEFLARLTEFCRRWGKGIDPLAWGVFMGMHRCELCERYHAAGNIGVPAGEVLYVAPEMVAHYVETHRYAPPPEFVAAVLAAPLPGTPEYVDAVAPFRAIALRQWADWTDASEPSEPPDVEM